MPNPQVFSWRQPFFSLTKFILHSHFKIIIQGKENIPECPSCLIVANHSSYLDVFVVGIAFFHNIINLRWVISQANYRIRSLEWFYAIYRVIPVNGTVEKVKGNLEENKWVVIFPEGAGRWCCLGQAQKLKPNTGTAAIALSTGVPIIPVGIQGADKALPVNSFKLKPAQTIRVNIGKPFQFSVYPEQKIPQDLLEEKTQEIMSRINACLSSAGN